MRLGEAAALIAVAWALAEPAMAADAAFSFDIPAGSLSEALIRLGEQAGLSVGAVDPGLARIRSPAVRGRMTTRAALARLLAGSGYTYAFTGPAAVRIVRAPAPPPRPIGRQPARTEAQAPPMLPPREIIVTGTKLGAALEQLGASIHVLDLDDGPDRSAPRGTAAIVERLPALANTSLGPGRDKLFIRGVADSSFNGPSQSVVGQYLGDVRLTFNAPDPNLQLYDIDQVEVLEGPQGTLYGSGSLGGIIRLVPNPPDLKRTSGTVAASASTIAHGDPGAALSALVNLPLAEDRVAVRAVGYASTQGGYIADLGRGLDDVNRTRVEGGRAALLADVGGGWQVEGGGLIQQLRDRDGDYALRGLPPLSRISTLPQPFESDYALGYLTVRKHAPRFDLVSTSAVVRQVLETRYDASGFPGTFGPQLYRENVGITLLSNETRISHPDPAGKGWLAGWSVLHDSGRIVRRLGPPDAVQPLAGIGNDTDEAAIFGQYSVAPTRKLLATAGARLSYTRSEGHSLDRPDEAGEPVRRDLRVTPMLSLTWRPSGRVLAYARVEQGFRAGGLSVQPGATRDTASRFQSDRLTAYEVGLSLGRRDVDRFSLDIAASYARWEEIQADLVDQRGLPFTANLGDGDIEALEIEAHWRPSAALAFELAAFFNDNALAKPEPAFAAANDRDLPNIADAGARGAVRYRKDLSPGVALSVDAAVRYVGKSELGIGPPADVEQGGYVDGQLSARLDLGRLGLWLEVANLADSRGNRFSFGNPFTLADHRQTTPLQPRTATLGVSFGF